MRLNLGAGTDVRQGWVNADIYPLSPDVLRLDLDEFPWPFDDDVVSEILARDVFEHVDHPIEFVLECHRILEQGGLLEVHTGYWRSMNAYTNPTHKRFCTEETFDFWIPGTHLHQNYPQYARGARFERIAIEQDGQEIVYRLRKM